MLSFPYAFKLTNKTYTGQLYTETGLFAGGSERTRTVTTTKQGNSTTKTYTHTDISVRLPSGKVRQVTKEGAVNIPSSTAITLFYFDGGKRYHPFHIHVHDTQETFRLSKAAEKNARRAILGWNIGRRAWARLIDGVTIAAGTISSAAAGIYCADTLDWGTFMGFVIFFVAMVASIMGFSAIAQWLGGGMLPYQQFESEIADITVKRGKQLSQTPQKEGSPLDDEGFVFGNANEGGLAMGNPSTSSSQEEASFKPMF